MLLLDIVLWIEDKCKKIWNWLLKRKSYLWAKHRVKKYQKKRGNYVNATRDDWNVGYDCRFL